MTKLWNSRYNSLRRWSLRNFKSVDAADVPLAPLTLVVGANSAGKSSLLQSILMLAQASVSRSDGQFPLNGTVVQLGVFGQVLSDFAAGPDADIHVSADFAFSSEATRSGSYIRSAPEELMGTLLNDRANELHHHPCLTVDLCLSPSEKQSSAEIHESDLAVRIGDRVLATSTVRTQDQPEVEAELSVTEGITSGRRVLGSGYVAQQRILDAEALTQTMPRAARVRRAGRFGFLPVTPDDGAHQTLNAVAFRAGVPIEGRSLTPDVELAVMEAVETAEMHVMLGTSKRISGLQKVRRSADELSASEAASRFIDYISPLVEALLDDARMEGRKSSLEEARKRLPKKVAERELLWAISQREDFFPVILPRALESLGADRDTRMRLGRPQEPLLKPWTQEWLDYLENSIHYLGPLREDPKVSYPHGVSGSSHLPIGRKGENTAATLLQDRGDLRRGIFPTPHGGKATSLNDALQQWVREFGLAQDVKPSDDGRYGVGLTVDERDLTSVGTGVSQILPVLVICLQARPGDLVLLEQPELHLNPGLQQRLGDFFLAMVRSGRQLIVETHSEYLVTRLRRHVAEDESDRTRRLFTLLFAVQLEGRTRFDVVDTRPDGTFDFTTWPEGFFDQAGDDVQAILRAVSRRRKAPAEK